METDRLLRGLLVASGLVLVAICPAKLGAEVDKDREVEKKEIEKKARPELDDRGHEEFHRRQIEEGEGNLKEIQRLLDEIQNGLSAKETGEGTQTRQKEVVKRLDELIKGFSKPCGKCQSSGSKKTSKSPGGSSQDRQKGKQQSASSESPQEAEARKRQNQLDAQRLEEQKAKDANGTGKVPNNQVADDKPPDNRGGPLVQRFRKAARWGLLPPKLREEMLSTGGKEAPAEYQSIIERYYKRLSDYYDHRRR